MDPVLERIAAWATQPGRRRVRPDLIAGAGVLAVLAVIGATIAVHGPRHAPPARPLPALTYRCSCTVVDEPWHPGETVRLAWTAVPATPGGGGGRVVLSAALWGPYPSAAAARRDVLAPAGARPPSTAGGGSTPPAHPISQSTVRAPTAPRPVVLLRLPAGCRPGWYELVTAADSSGSALTEAAVVHVE